MIVLDASVVIAALSLSDLLHDRALRLLAEQVDEQLVMHAVTRAEVLVAPVRAGRADVVEGQLDGLGVSTVGLRSSDALALAQLRSRTGMKLPDCCVLLAAMESGAVVATFDDQLARAAERLHLAVLT